MWLLCDIPSIFLVSLFLLNSPMSLRDLPAYAFMSIVTNTVAPNLCLPAQYSDNSLARSVRFWILERGIGVFCVMSATKTAWCFNFQNCHPFVNAMVHLSQGSMCQYTNSQDKRSYVDGMSVAERAMTGGWGVILIIARILEIKVSGTMCNTWKPREIFCGWFVLLTVSCTGQSCDVLRYRIAG